MNVQNVKRPVTVYAEDTPNPASMKFVTDIMLSDRVLEFTSKDQTKNAPLAASLFNFPFVTSVFITSNFVTVIKNDSIQWNDVALRLREFIQQYLSEGNPVVTAAPESKAEPGNKKAGEPVFHSRPASEVEEKIVDILEEYVRPAVEGDGGAIHFKSFDDGIVTVVLRGSCSGCPSSSITLKAGIEGLLKRMVPEVKEVVAESL